LTTDDHTLNMVSQVPIIQDKRARTKEENPNMTKMDAIQLYRK